MPMSLQLLEDTTSPAELISYFLNELLITCVMPFAGKIPMSSINACLMHQLLVCIPVACAHTSIEQLFAMEEALFTFFLFHFVTGPVVAEAMFVNREEIPVLPIYRDPVSGNVVAVYLKRPYWLQLFDPLNSEINKIYFVFPMVDPFIPAYRLHLTILQVHDFGFFRYDPDAIQFLDYEEITLAPEVACVGLEIRVVGNDSGEKVC